LPDDAVILGTSKRIENEIFGIGNQVLCMQCHPEFNATHIQRNAIEKRYDRGLLDDAQKKEAENLTHNN